MHTYFKSTLCATVWVRIYVDYIIAPTHLSSIKDKRGLIFHISFLFRKNSCPIPSPDQSILQDTVFNSLMLSYMSGGAFKFLGDLRQKNVVRVGGSQCVVEDTLLLPVCSAMGKKNRLKNNLKDGQEKHGQQWEKYAFFFFFT